MSGSIGRLLWIISAALALTTPRVFAHDNKANFVKSLEDSRSQTILTYGTSLTASGAWVEQLHAVLDRKFPGKVTVINSGKNGMTSGWAVKNLDALVISKKPDVVFVEFSINDAFQSYGISTIESKRNVETIIDRISKSNPNCEIILMIMNRPIGTHLEKRPRIKEYEQVYRDVAHEQGLRLIDHSINWQKMLKYQEPMWHAFVPDGIHPNANGCKSVVLPMIVRSIGLD